MASTEAEASLLEAAKSMNQEALVAIFDLYSAALYNYALRLCSDPMAADHIVGDVFAKFLDQLAAGKGPTTNLRSYLYQMTYHLIIDQARSKDREAPLEVMEFVPTNGRTSFSGLEDRMLMDALLTAIQSELTEDQRHVIILRFLEGFSLRETADIIGKQVYNVKVIQNRGIAKLRKTLNHKVSL
ncbi:MAG TPA: sigma-70 family RNA polymerase sigma factor [Anaerolineales bacterium]|nr:sigma-70 family RNA polymerase sigma factor [Anaerolineales bacterium]